MRLTAITDAILEESVRAQPTDEFDTHDVIFWISRNYPQEYAEDLYRGRQDRGDPFVNFHAAIGRRLAQLPYLVEAQGRKRQSRNVRNGTDRCELWRRLP